MGWILHPGACDAQLLHDTVQKPLNIVLRHPVPRAGATRRSLAELQAEDEAEKPEPRSGAKHCHLRVKKDERQQTQLLMGYSLYTWNGCLYRLSNRCVWFNFYVNTMHTINRRGQRYNHHDQITLGNSKVALNQFLFERNCFIYVIHKM